MIEGRGHQEKIVREIFARSTKFQPYLATLVAPPSDTLPHTAPCPGKKEASSFSTISLAFLDRFL